MRTHPVLYGFLVFVVTLCSSAAIGSEASDVRPQLSDLRSAYLLRGGPNYARTLDDAVDQLKAHFDVVIDVLESQSKTSLSTAVLRLEQQTNAAWDDLDRRQARADLAENRRHNIANLKAYRDSGRFPINDLGSGHPTPIFVDSRGTACAVGHLMCEADWTEAVRQIAAANNLVYLTDIDEGAAVDWILQSGLLHEEAALIQPTYGETVSAQYTIPESQDGNVRYENFGIQLLDDPSVFGIEHIGSYQSVGRLSGQMDLWLRNPIVFDETYVPQEDDWLFVGHMDYFARPGFGVGAHRSQHVRFSYDVVAQDGDSIDTFHQSLEDSFNWNLPPVGVAILTGGTISVDTTISDASGISLATLNLNDFNDHAVTSFAPQASLHVETEFITTGDAIFNSIVHEFGTFLDIAPFDFSGDTQLDVADLDMLTQQIASGNITDTYDIDKNGKLDLGDLDYWLDQAARVNGFAEPFRYGDTDLNGVVGSHDLNVVGSNWLSTDSRWSAGDFNADGKTNAIDLNFVGVNWQSAIAQAAPAPPIPEPRTITLAIVFALGAVFRMRSERA